MKKFLFVLSVLVAFIVVPLSIFLAGVASASFIGVGSGMFLANFTGNAPVSGPFSFAEFVGVSIGAIIVTYVYAKFAMAGVGHFARWADEVKLS